MDDAINSSSLKSSGYIKTQFRVGSQWFTIPIMDYEDLEHEDVKGDWCVYHQRRSSRSGIPER